MAPNNLEDQTLIPAARVKELLGGISDMTLWRWLNEADIAFPAPVRINGRRYWRTDELRSWLERRRDPASANDACLPSDADLRRIDAAIEDLPRGMS